MGMKGILVEPVHMLIRRIARPMLAAMLINGGIAALRASKDHAHAARPVLDMISPAVNKAVDISPIDRRPDDETLIKIDAGVKILAGAMLAMGRLPRLSATVLAASLVPTTLASHRFWEISDPDEKEAQLLHFVKNVSLLGGLLIAAGDSKTKASRKRR